MEVNWSDFFTKPQVTEFFAFLCLVFGAGLTFFLLKLKDYEENT
jgi:hypothetical protein